MEFLGPTEAHLTDLKNQVVSDGGQLDVRICFDNGEAAEGTGIFSIGEVKRGDTLMKIPFSLCISVEKILCSSLRVVIDENPGLMEYPDEVMALGIMHGIDNLECEWHKHILTMPSTFNTPLYWPDEDLEMMNGSIIYHLTLMMKRRMASDYESLHQPLIQQYPALFSGASFEKYIWAMSVIYSRAIGISRNNVYTRCIPPLLDMANHNPLKCEAGVEPLAYSEDGDFLYLMSSTDASSGEQIYVRYSAYPNSKLLYSYGFVLSHNPDRAIDLWPRVPPTAYRAAEKNDLLRSHPLTQEQTYDFKGTIRSKYVSPALLATCRVIKADEEDWPNIENAFHGKLVSVKNELAAYESLYGLVVGRMTVEKAQVLLFFGYDGFLILIFKNFFRMKGGS